MFVNSVVVSKLEISIVSWSGILLREGSGEMNGTMEDEGPREGERRARWRDVRACERICRQGLRA